MKNRSYILLIISAFLIIGVGSCTIKKRSYQPGYYVDWYNVNKKSKSNSENVSEKNQKIEKAENKDVEKVVEQNEMLHYPEIEQDNSPVFSSTDENQTNVEIIKTTEQSKLIKYNKKENLSVGYTSLNKTKVQKLSEQGGEKKPVNDLAIAGFGLSVVSALCFIGTIFSDSVVFFLLFLFLPGLICGIVGLTLSIIAISVILLNKDEYSGLWLAIAGLAIPILLLIVMYWGFWPLIAFMVVLLALIILLVAIKNNKHAG